MIALHASDRYQRLASLGLGVGDEVLELVL
jgi:hypothetical protein